MADKKKAPRFTSPKGIFRYPYLVKPDFGTKDFPKPNGEYKVSLVLDENDPAVQEFLDKIQPLYDAAIEQGEAKFKELKVEQRKKLKELNETDLYSVEYDRETEEPTGNIIFKFVTAASGKNAKGEEWERKVPLFDAKGKPCTLKSVGGGTVGKINFEVSPYFIPGTGLAGLKLYLVAAQIIELNHYSGADASAYGFGAEEGFSAEDAAPEDDDDDDDDPPYDADDSGSSNGDDEEDF